MKYKDQNCVGVTEGIQMVTETILLECDYKPVDDPLISVPDWFIWFCYGPIGSPKVQKTALVLTVQFD